MCSAVYTPLKTPDILPYAMALDLQLTEKQTLILLRL